VWARFLFYSDSSAEKQRPIIQFQIRSGHVCVEFVISDHLYLLEDIHGRERRTCFKISKNLEFKIANERKKKGKEDII
jgi:hypothetical protein